MKPQPLVLVLGGARSGKSKYAENLALRAGRPVTYVATAGPPRDGEMAERIEIHKARRPQSWRTVEETRDLHAVLATASAQDIVLLDCLTLWLTNVMLAEADVEKEIGAFVAALEARSAAVIAVANEVGEGIVPATPLGRRFRDWQGVLNQRVAGAASDVVKLVAGCPLILKPRHEPEPSL